MGIYSKDFGATPYRVHGLPLEVKICQSKKGVMFKGTEYDLMIDEYLFSSIKWTPSWSKTYFVTFFRVLKGSTLR